MSLKVKNWTQYQHYKDRKPSWIKLHRSLLDDLSFARLPLASRALAPFVWLLAAESKDGSISSSAHEVAWRLRQDENEVHEALEGLIASGFLMGTLDASESVSNRTEPYRGASLEKRREREREEREKSSASPSARGVSWIREACDDWIERYQGTAHGGRIGKALKPLVADKGWPSLRPSWRNYLKQTKGEFASPERFAATYGEWCPKEPEVPEGLPMPWERPVPEDGQ